MSFYKMGSSIGRRDRLTYDLVRRVQSNDKGAILELLDIFDAKIRQYASVGLYDCWGNPVTVQDHDYVARLEDKLVQAFMEMDISDAAEARRKKNKQKKTGGKPRVSRSSFHGCGQAARRHS